VTTTVKDIGNAMEKMGESAVETVEGRRHRRRVLPSQFQAPGPRGGTRARLHGPCRCARRKNEADRRAAARDQRQDRQTVRSATERPGNPFSVASATVEGQQYQYNLILAPLLTSATATPALALGTLAILVSWARCVAPCWKRAGRDGPVFDQRAA